MRHQATLIKKRYTLALSVSMHVFYILFVYCVFYQNSIENSLKNDSDCPQNIVQDDRTSNHTSHAAISHLSLSWHDDIIPAVDISSQKKQDDNPLITNEKIVSHKESQKDVQEQRMKKTEPRIRKKRTQKESSAKKIDMPGYRPIRFCDIAQGFLDTIAHKREYGIVFHQDRLANQHDDLKHASYAQKLVWDINNVLQQLEISLQAGNHEPHLTQNLVITINQEGKVTHIAFTNQSQNIQFENIIREQFAHFRFPPIPHHLQQHHINIPIVINALMRNNRYYVQPIFCR